MEQTLNLEFINILTSLGYKTTVAKTLAAFRIKQPMTSREIEKLVDLRQPEVSNALTELKERAWILEKEETIKSGTGRPQKIYLLSKTMIDIAQEIAKTEQENLKSREVIISRLITLCNPQP